MKEKIKFKCSAFTLAEVLITMAIIGIVAAVTIPMLVNNYQKKVTVIKLRKIYTEINNAFQLSIVDNGDAISWNYPPTPGNQLDDFIKTYYLPYFKDATFKTSTQFHQIQPHIYSISGVEINRTAEMSGLILNNGVFIRFFCHYPAANNYLWLYVDLNGNSGPNRVGRDIFVLNSYITNKINIINFYGNDQVYSSLGTGNGYYVCRKTTSSYSGFFCGELIKRNNWKIPDNYPW